MAATFRDLNRDVAGELYDLALVHRSRHGRIAYRRAAQAVLRLEERVDAVAARGSLREIRHIGPASERVILEHLEHGASDTVRRAVEGSGRAEEVRAAHALRTNFLSRAGALRAIAAPAEGAVGRADVRGDLQMHTEWSDGSESIADMAEAARARGYGWIGVSDHSYGLRIAGGMSMEDAARQRREIERLNRTWAGAFRVFHGIEGNIPKEGGIDLANDELAQFEIVLAAPHSLLRRPEDQTERMLAAVRHPGVHVLAHPRGRMYTRQGVLADWDRVFAEAARHDVAVELDGDPWRQDLDHALARRALAAGCRFALDSDAHSGAELRYAEFALAHARLAGIPAGRVIDTWPADALLQWASSKSATGR
jgi:histidinol phosphatase-like PHP family hydrolase